MSDKTAALKMKDSSGNIDRILPKTKVANVEGLEDWDSAMLLKNVTVALPASAKWYSVCYGNGKFVVVARNSTIAAYSTDGITWTQATLPISKNWSSVCYGNGKFVAVASNTDIAAYSTDSITWTNVADVVNHPAGTDITSNLKKVLGVDTILSDANAYTDSAISDKATMTEVNTAIQAAIQNTWEASY